MYISKRIVRDIRAYCVDSTPEKERERLAQERDEESEKQNKAKKRKEWEESEYQRLYDEMINGVQPFPSPTPAPAPTASTQPKPKAQTSKKCKRCGRLLVIGSFGKNGDGRIYDCCQSCQSKSTSEVKKMLGKRVQDGAVVWRHCSRCGLAKEISSFIRCKTCISGFFGICKECRAEKEALRKSQK